MAAIYRQEIIQNVTLFTSQGATRFYDKLFNSLEFTIPRAATGRLGFPKEALICAFIVMKCEIFLQITDLVDYLNNNRLIAYYCGFDIMKPLPSYWTYDRFLKKLNHAQMKKIMVELVKQLYNRGIVDASFVGLDSTPVMANTRQNNSKAFMKNKFSKEVSPKSDPDCALGVHSASNQHSERRYEFYWGYKNHVLVDCISGLPLYELTTPANITDSTVTTDILAAADQTIPLQECSFLADKGYDVKIIYNTMKSVYDGEVSIPLNQRHSSAEKKFSADNPICDDGLTMHKDGKTNDRGQTRQKFCCPFRQSKHAVCPYNHKNWNNGKKHRGCTKYKTIPNDYRLSIDRSCLYFKKTYALRSKCERYYSRFKATGQEHLWVCNGSSAANLNTLAHISSLTVALAAVLFGSHSYRAPRSFRRSA